MDDVTFARRLFLWRPGGEDHVALDRHRQHKAIVVVGVLADEIHPAGSGDDPLRGVAKDFGKTRGGASGEVGERRGGIHGKSFRVRKLGRKKLLVRRELLHSAGEGVSSGVVRWAFSPSRSGYPPVLEIADDGLKAHRTTTHTTSAAFPTKLMASLDFPSQRNFTVKKLLLVIVVGFSPLMGWAEDKPPLQGKEYQDPTVFDVNTEPVHATMRPYPNAELALADDRANNPRMKSLNGTWEFKWVKTPDLAPKGFEQPEFDTHYFNQIKVPANWELEGYDTPFYHSTDYTFPVNPPLTGTKHQPVGCYRREFELPADWKGQQVFLHFDGVMSAMLPLREWQRGGLQRRQHDAGGVQHHQVSASRART